MVSWSEVVAAEPAFAVAVRAYFDAHTHKTIATLRRDGAPRISGIEAVFADDGLSFGSMWEARKALDLRRDPRFALHSASEDPPAWHGDAKIAGRAVEVDLAASPAGSEGPGGPSHRFLADITEVSLVRLGEPADHLVIEVWTPQGGLRRMRR